jgi:hypothetical protein
VGSSSLSSGKNGLSRGSEIVVVSLLFFFGEKPLNFGGDGIHPYLYLAGCFLPVLLGDPLGDGVFLKGDVQPPKRISMFCSSCEIDIFFELIKKDCFFGSSII